MPLEAAADFGTEADETLNDDYCIYCYKNGKFTIDCTMEEMIRLCAPYHAQIPHDDGSPYTEEEAVKLMQEMFPKLKRWKK